MGIQNTNADERESYRINGENNLSASDNLCGDIFIIKSEGKGMEEWGYFCPFSCFAFCFVCSNTAATNSIPHAGQFFHFGPLTGICKRETHKIYIYIYLCVIFSNFLFTIKF